MTKEQTYQIKGIAILLMLWLHLFGSGANIEQCEVLLTFWNGEPLALAMRKLCSVCVNVFIFVGGYGLAKTYERTGGDMHNGRRVWHLYKTFWMVFLLFYPLGCIMNGDLFMSSVGEILLNATAMDNTFNGAWWFLLPYAVLTLVSGWIMRMLYAASTRKVWLIIAACVVLYVVGYFDDKVSTPWYIADVVMRNAMRFMAMLLCFVGGALYARHDIMHKVRQRAEKLLGRRRNAVLLLALLLLALLKMSIGASGLLNPPFVFLIVTAFVCLDVERHIAGMLGFMGRHSAVMWLCHFFFITYIFDGWIFRLRYIPLIYATLVVLSLMVSLLLNRRRQLSVNS